MARMQVWKTKRVAPSFTEDEWGIKITVCYTAFTILHMYDLKVKIPLY